jgi:outer membrane protein, heavy metal efflux system
LNVENDLTQLNMLTYRRPDEPLVVEENIELKPLKSSLDELIDRATESRQEILQAALSERSAETATTLARMEYLPDYTVTYFFDDYLLPSGAPAPSRTEDHSLTLAFNVPIYFWWHQREDVQSSQHDLAAARYDLGSIKNQTAAAITSLYWTALYAYRQAALYRDSLIPLARQGFQVALVAYETGKLNFAQLQDSYQQLYTLQIVHLQFENQHLAQRVAIEQTVGSLLPQ